MNASRARHSLLEAAFHAAVANGLCLFFVWLYIGAPFFDPLMGWFGATFLFPEEAPPRCGLAPWTDTSLACCQTIQGYWQPDANDDDIDDRCFDMTTDAHEDVQLVAI